MLNLLFPWRCVACDAYVDPDSLTCRVCETSMVQVGHACRICAQPRDIFDDEECLSCTGWTSDVTGVSAMWRYEGALVDALIRVKRRRQLWVLKRLAEASKAMVHERLADVDGVTWVPASSESLDERGFSVAALLARWWVGRRARQPLVIEGAHSRQKSLGRKERWENASRFKAVSSVAGRWLVVDDILTTGATVQAVARELRAAGASAVEVAVLGRTPRYGIP